MATTRFEIGSGNVLRKDTATGSAAIAASMSAIKATKITSVTLHLDAAPTTSENFTITLNALAGAAYDTLLYSLDLSVGSTVDLVWQPDNELILQAGDSLDVAYTNTDTGTYGLEITTVEMI